MTETELLTFVADQITRANGAMPNLGTFAVAYATSGLEVFPLKPTNKRPYNSQHLATTDIDVVDEWWERWPDALIGHRIPLARITLDIDPRHGGLETWELLDDVYGPIPIGRKHFSGRNDGGFHATFLRPEGMERLSAKRLHDWARDHQVGSPILDNEGRDTGRWTSGIDLLHHNWRYTILPPSPHPATGDPYRWPEVIGDPGPLHPELAKLLEPINGQLTEQEEGDHEHQEDGEHPPGSVPLSALEHPDSIADWYSAWASWNDILPPAGWTLVQGDGDADGSLWRHPAATQEHSASMRHGCLFVYTPNTVFTETESGDPHGITRFAAYTLLQHDGDGNAAASAARAIKTGQAAPAIDVDQPDDPPRFRRWRLSDVAAAGLDLTWLATGLLPHDTFGVTAGELKSLKSYLGMARDIAIAAGLPVLGHWPVPERARVLVHTGEGGRKLYTRRAQRVAQAYGIGDLHDLDEWLQIVDDVAPLSGEPFRQGLRRNLGEFGPALTHVDPLYAFQPADVDSNRMAEVGRMLAEAQQVCAEHGSMFWTTVHMNQTGQGFDLKRITGAGHGEWADTWLLSKHRRTPDVAAGRFWLLVAPGSRQGFGGEFDVDIDIGRFDPVVGLHDGPIRWSVNSAGSAPASTVDPLTDVKLDVMRVGRKFRSDRSRQSWLARVERRNEVKRAAFDELVDEGSIVVGAKPDTFRVAPGR